MSFLSDDKAFRIWLETMGLDDMPLQDTPTNWYALAQRAENALTQGAEEGANTGAPASRDPGPHQKNLHTAPKKAAGGDALLKVSPHAQRQTARELAARAHDLNALREAVLSFEGCALKKTATNTVFGDGNPNAGVMLIGEAPGADEDQQGKPFVGVSGQLLSKGLGAIGLKDRAAYYITNMIPWRPPGNRQPSADELAACLPFMEKHIELVNPKVIVFIGGTSAKTLLQTNQGVTKLRGQAVFYTLPKTQARNEKKFRSLILYHPAYLLRSPSKKEVFWYDLLTLKNLLSTL